MHTLGPKNYQIITELCTLYYLLPGTYKFPWVMTFPKKSVQSSSSPTVGKIISWLNLDGTK